MRPSGPPSLTPREKKFSGLKDALEFAGLGATPEEQKRCADALSKGSPLLWKGPGHSVVSGECREAVSLPHAEGPAAVRSLSCAAEEAPRGARRVSLDLTEMDIASVSPTQPVEGAQTVQQAVQKKKLEGEGEEGRGDLQEGLENLPILEWKEDPRPEPSPRECAATQDDDDGGANDVIIIDDDDCGAAGIPRTTPTKPVGIPDSIPSPVQKRMKHFSPLREGSVLKMLKVGQGDVKQKGREIIVNNSKLNKQLELAGLLKISKGETVPDDAATYQKRVTKKNEASAPELSEQQARALQAALQGKNIFVTGGAGVGKSFVTNLIVKKLKESGRTVQITASTGIAAVNVNGQTIHSFSGIGLGVESKMVLGSKARKNKQTVNRWRATDVLVIDEISMIKADLFEKVEHVGTLCRTGFGEDDTVRKVGKATGPFAGIQVIVVGDFLQLPPVADRSDTRTGVKFAFECKLWEECAFENILLTKVFRQSDAVFVNLLNDLRVGRVSKTSSDLLLAAGRPLDKSDKVEPTQLYPFRKDVLGENKRKFDKLPGDIVRYDAEDKASSKQAVRHLESLDKNLQAYKTLETKEGMQVVLLANLNTEVGLCNGSRGVIIGYESPNEDNMSDVLKDVQSSAEERKCVRSWMRAQHKLPVVIFANKITKVIGPHKWDMKVNNGRDTIFRRQIPLAAAWALTIHKCQGMTLDRVIMNLKNVFDDGMAYVALSRARCLEGTQLLGFDSRLVKANPRVLDFYSRMGMDISGKASLGCHLSQKDQKNIPRDNAPPARARKPARSLENPIPDNTRIMPPSVLPNTNQPPVSAAAAPEMCDEAMHMVLATSAVTEKYIQKQIGAILSFAQDPDEARAMINAFQAHATSSLQSIFKKCSSQMDGSQ